MSWVWYWYTVMRKPVLQSATVVQSVFILSPYLENPPACGYGACHGVSFYLLLNDAVVIDNFHSKYLRYLGWVTILLCVVLPPIYRSFYVLCESHHFLWVSCPGWALRRWKSLLLTSRRSLQHRSEITTQAAPLLQGLQDFQPDLAVICDAELSVSKGSWPPPTTLCTGVVGGFGRFADSGLSALLNPHGTSPKCWGSPCCWMAGWAATSASFGY